MTWLKMKQNRNIFNLPVALSLPGLGVMALQAARKLTQPQRDGAVLRRQVLELPPRDQTAVCCSGN